MARQHTPSESEAQETRGIPALIARVARKPRSKWVIVAIWVVLLAAVIPFASKLSSLEDNDAAAFLPESAESLRVNELQQQFPNGDGETAVVVYHRASGLTEADLGSVAADREALSQHFDGAPVSDAIPSGDGRAVIYSVVVTDEDIVGHVDDIRSLVVVGDGLDVLVTGPAGFSADLQNVFEGIDSTLLLATAAVVTIILLLIYRSPFLWLMPLLTVAFALQAASGAIYGLGRQFDLNLNGASLSILPILVFGVGTDYALLLIARYREELRRYESKYQAMAQALRNAVPAILASGGTTIVGLSCLIVADLNSTSALAVVGAVGIASTLLAMLTLLPAVLVIFGRRIFWPFVPRVGSVAQQRAGVWARIGNRVSARPRPVWIGTALALMVLALGLINIDTGLSQADSFRDEPDAIAGQKLIASSYPAGASAPTTIIAQADLAAEVETATLATDGVADVRLDGVYGDLAVFSATLDSAPSSKESFDTIDRLREQVRAVPGANALVGGSDAMDLDVARASERDRMVVIPLVLVVVLIILTILLRSLVAPLMLTATIVLSYAAALGASVIVFDRVFGFAGMDPTVPLLGFVFLVTLGIDYNIFLMSRIHEEAKRVGTRAGTLRGLAVTGGVITSAGVVLAATFSVIGVLPLVFAAQLGFIVAFGVLLETLVVRSILVPALTLDLDRVVWWPGALARKVIATPDATVVAEEAFITAGE